MNNPNGRYKLQRQNISGGGGWEDLPYDRGASDAVAASDDLEVMRELASRNAGSAGGTRVVDTQDRCVVARYGTGRQHLQ